MIAHHLIGHMGDAQGLQKVSAVLFGIGLKPRIDAALGALFEQGDLTVGLDVYKRQQYNLQVGFPCILGAALQLTQHQKSV